jgi:MFS family permease
MTIKHRTFILIGNSVHPHERGTINGIAQSMVAVSRIVGPIAAAAVFAATASGDRAWPLDYHLIFHIVGVLFLCLAFLSTQFKGDVQKKKPLIQTASSRRRQRRRDMPAVDAGADDQSLITNDAIEETTTSVQ